MPKEYVLTALYPEGFLSTPLWSFHFLVLMVSQREYVSVTALSGVIVIRFYFTSILATNA